MSTAVVIKLKDGRTVPFGKASTLEQATEMKAQLARWFRGAATLTGTNARGELEDVTPQSVVTIDLMDEMLRPPTPGNSGVA